jgi:antitoxin HigA-1
MTRKLKPMHPGEVLREEFLVPLKMSTGAFAKICGLPRTRIERIANEQTGITADTALRLGKALGTTAQLWLNLQNHSIGGTNDPRMRTSLQGERPRAMA